MKMGSIFGVVYAAIAIATATPAAAHGVGETVTPHFQQTIPNIPGKSLKALVVDYAPGGASAPHIHDGRPASGRRSPATRFRPRGRSRR